jgi:hypothetical protein
VKELGGGGMSRVFLAEETRLSRQVVIKVLPPYEASGQRRRAAEAYGRFVELWKAADPELQPAVREVRGRLAQLAQEPGA